MSLTPIIFPIQLWLFMKLIDFSRKKSMKKKKESSESEDDLEYDWVEHLASNCPGINYYVIRVPCRCPFIADTTIKEALIHLHKNHGWTANDAVSFIKGDLELRKG